MQHTKALPSFLRVPSRMKTIPLSQETLAAGVLAISVTVAVWRGAWALLIAALAIFLICFGLFPKQLVLALLAASLVLVLFIPRSNSNGYRYEGFTDGSGTDTVITDACGNPITVPAPSEDSDDEKKDGKKEETENDKDNEREGFDSPAPIGSMKPLIPDNAERAEPLVLGKPYKLPSEKDDVGIHLDAGTTFLNAYKALKPDQIAAMTRDTQELIATQKSLVAMLDSFGPMLKDMNKITGFFGASQ